MVNINPKHFQQPPSKWDKYAKKLTDILPPVRLWWPANNTPTVEGSGEYLSLDTSSFNPSIPDDSDIQSITYSHDSTTNMTTYMYQRTRNHDDIQFPGSYGTSISIHDGIIEQFITNTRGYPELIITTENAEAYRHFTNHGYIKITHY